MAHRQDPGQLRRLGREQHGLNGPPLEIQIARVELRQPFQPVPIEDREPAICKSDQVATADFLDGSISVDHRQPEALRKLSLRERKLVGIALRRPYHVETLVKLAKEVRHAGNRGTPAK